MIFRAKQRRLQHFTVQNSQQTTHAVFSVGVGLLVTVVNTEIDRQHAA
jgi:hypothetical protein